MLHAPAPPNEEARLAALRGYEILDTPPEREWDDLARTYAPEVHALTVDQAQFKLYASKGKVEAPRAAWGLTVRRGRTYGSLSVDFVPQRKVVTVHGALPGSRTLLGEFALPEPHRAAARLLGGELRVWNGAAPKGAPGYTITHPAAGSYTITIAPGEEIGGLDFGLHVP